jgi:NitT/TauT family transport system substrate-binding protein
MRALRLRHWCGLLVAGLLAGLALLGCGGTLGAGRAPEPPTVAPVAGSGSPPSLIKARSAYTTTSAAAAPWWVALEAGYFLEQGLDVTLSHVDAGAALLAALYNGELDITFAGAPTFVLGYLQGMETMIIGATSNVLDASIFVRPEIQRIEDLRGKTIGVTRLKAITDVAARLGLKRMGLEPDVDFFTRGTGGPAEALAALEAGTIDGASLPVPALFEARKRGFREILNVGAMNIPFMGSAVGGTRKTLTERPELGEPYLRALAQAVSRLKTDREFAIQVIGKYSRSTDYELLGATVDYYRPLYTVDPYPEPAAVQAVIDAEEHPGARTLRPEEMTDYRFAERLRASGFLNQLPQ